MSTFTENFIEDRKGTNVKEMLKILDKKITDEAEQIKVDLGMRDLKYENMLLGGFLGFFIGILVAIL